MAGATEAPRGRPPSAALTINARTRKVPLRATGGQGRGFQNARKGGGAGGAGLGPRAPAPPRPDSWRRRAARPPPQGAAPGAPYLCVELRRGHGGPRGADAPRLCGGRTSSGRLPAPTRKRRGCSRQGAGQGQAGRAAPGGAGWGGASQPRAASGGLAITPGLAASSVARSACPGSSGSPPLPTLQPVMLLPPPPPSPCALWEREEAALQRCNRGCSGFSRAHAASHRLRAPGIISLSASVAAASSRAAETQKPAPGHPLAAHRPRDAPGPKRALDRAE